MDTRRSFCLAPGQDDFAESAPDASRVNYNDIPYITAANDNFRVVRSTGQCNTACSLSAGVWKPKVFRGR
jgi:hypothetical protein